MWIGKPRLPHGEVHEHQVCIQVCLHVVALGYGGHANKTRMCCHVVAWRHSIDMNMSVRATAWSAGTWQAGKQVSTWQAQQQACLCCHVVAFGDSEGMSGHAYSSKRECWAWRVCKQVQACPSHMEVLGHSRRASWSLQTGMCMPAQSGWHCATAGR